MKLFKNKKGISISVVSIFFGILIFIACFSGLFYFYSDQMSEANMTSDISLDPSYNTTYQNIWNKTFSIQTTVQSIRDSLSDVTDAKSSATDVLYGGVTGIANVLLLPISLISTVLEIFNLIVLPFASIPSWAITLGSMALLILLIYAVARGATGRIEL